MAPVRSRQLATVTRFKVGDRVAGCFAQGWFAGPPSREKLLNTKTLGGPLDGMLAEQVVLHENGIIPSGNITNRRSCDTSLRRTYGVERARAARAYKAR